MPFAPAALMVLVIPEPEWLIQAIHRMTGEVPHWCGSKLVG